jgi:beta-glucosidase
LEKSAAVLMAWHPGIEAGHGVADVLTGKVAPTGRLTTSFPRSVGQVPVHYNHLHTSRPFSDYKDGTREALLPFGFGLTYTTFAYGPTRFSRDTLAMGGAITISTTLTNTGKAAGTETAQLYLHDVACLQGARPVRELKGFQQVTLAPGESREVSFTLRADELGSWSPDGKWVVEPGRFEATIAANAASGEMAAFTLQP